MKCSRALGARQVWMVVEATTLTLTISLGRKMDLTETTAPLSFAFALLVLHSALIPAQLPGASVSF
jgi:hypothetical protein